MRRRPIATRCVSERRTTKDQAPRPDGEHSIRYWRKRLPSRERARPLDAAWTGARPMMQLCFIIMRLLSAFANVIEAFARRVAKRGVKPVDRWNITPERAA